MMKIFAPLIVREKIVSVLYSEMEGLALKYEEFLK